MATTEKYCPKCEKWKSFEEFYKNRSQKDGYQSYCKPCWKQLTAESKLRHLEARRAKGREFAQEFRQKHPDVQKARYKDWYERNGSEYHREWQEQNRQSVQESTRRWRANHPIASQVSGNNTRSKREGAAGIVTEQEWIAILEAYEYRCASCKEQRKLEIDHIMPIAFGGANMAGNLQPLCHACNTRKRQRLTDYRKSKE